MAEPLINSTHVLLNACENDADFIDSAGGAEGGASILTDPHVDRRDAGGYAWDPANAAIRSSHSGADAVNELGGTMLAPGAEFGPIDGTVAKRLFYTGHYTSQGSALTITPNVSVGTGYMFCLFSDRPDRTDGVRIWSLGGRDTVPTLFDAFHGHISVDAAHLASAVDIGVGTEVETADATGYDPTNIVSAGWPHKATAGTSRFYGTISRFGYYDAFTLVEGDAANPGTFLTFYNQALSENHYAMAVSGNVPSPDDGSGQFLGRMAMEFGDRDLLNTRSAHFKVANGAIQFDAAVQDKNISKIRTLHAPFNKIGLEEKLRNGDTWRAINFQFFSQTPWHWRFAANVGATVEFNGCTIQNAGGTDDDCEIDSDVTVSGGLIDNCGKLSINGATIQNATISNPANTHGTVITTASTLTNVAFSTDTAADHAIEIDTAGTYNFTGHSYSGFTTDIDVTATSGTVTINVLGGGDTPTTTSAGATVNVVNSKSITFNFNFPGSSPVDFEWRLYEDSPTPGVIGTVELDGAENETVFTQIYTYPYTVDTACQLQVIAEGFEESLTPVTLKNSDQTIDVFMTAEENL